MKASQIEVKNALMTVSEHLNVRKNMKLLLDLNGLHSTVREVIIKLFIENVNDTNLKDGNVYIAFQLLREYCKEMYVNGEVKFDEQKSYDINKPDYYEHGKPELRERTKARLTEIFEAGMIECGIAEFGFEGFTSGLYIEKVWHYTDEQFNDYMVWAKGIYVNRSKY